MRNITLSVSFLWITFQKFFGYGTAATAVQLNIITIILGEDPNYGWYATGPMYDIAFRHVDKFYPGLLTNSTRYELYQRNITDCFAAAANVAAVAGQMFGLVDGSNGTTVVFSPGCSPEVLPLADIARGAAGKGSMGPAVVFFLTKFKWVTVSVYCESVLNYPSVASLFGNQCRAIKTLTMSPTSGFNIYYEDFDSVRNPCGFESLLSRARERSRIIVLVTRQDVVRKIMIRAYFMNMTTGDYVFVYLEPSRIPRYISLLEPTNDSRDDVATEAFEAMIVCQFDPWETPRTARIFQEVAERAATFYNYTYRPDEMVNEYSLAAYDAVHVFADVLNQLTTEQLPLIQRNFRRRLLNQTFHTYSRNVSIGADAYRLENVLYNRFNPATKAFDTGWKYNAAANTIEATSREVADRWHGRSDPLPNQPPCGFLGELCHENAITGSTLGLLITASAFLLLLVPAFVWTSRTNLWGFRSNHLTFEDSFRIDENFLVKN